MIAPTPVQPRVITNNDDIPSIEIASISKSVRCTYLGVTWQLSVDCDSGDAVLSTVRSDVNQDSSLHVKKFPALISAVDIENNHTIIEKALEIIDSLAQRDFIIAKVDQGE